MITDILAYVESLVVAFSGFYLNKFLVDWIHLFRRDSVGHALFRLQIIFNEPSPTRIKPETLP